MKSRTTAILATAVLLGQTMEAVDPPQVKNVTAAQRAGTKLVDISYDLVLDQNETSAFIEAWFSWDNGKTFPISAAAVTGDSGAGQTTGVGKAIVWDAGVDWDQNFTQAGKIRIIATYGANASGVFAGHNFGDSDMVALEWTTLWRSDPGQPGQWTEDNMLPAMFENYGSSIDIFRVDPKEITNAQWNEVAQWALSNGYDGLPVVPDSVDGSLPVTNINYFQAIKWCNARSEKDGLSPAYYIDQSELIGDLNGDGTIANGQDTFSPFSAEDLNQNGKWDPGEPFTDNNGNQTFEGTEFKDLDGDTTFDPGLATPYRTGASISGYGVSDPQAPEIDPVFSFIKWDAQGYRLPLGDIQQYLAIAGNIQKNWPWGDSAPMDAFFSETSIVAGMEPQVSFPAPVAASKRGTSPLGLKDILGNVAEWSEEMREDPGQPGTLKNVVYGGSYQGLGRAGTWNQQTATYEGEFSGTGSTPGSLFEAFLYGDGSTGTPAIGLRTVRFK